ncbi:hypothetical protein M9Y90_05415 [Leptospira interrogans]|uniref:hypothetical protein n=1 Tax=Leptospira interrogans TaxID=173 RepID=UPI001F4D0C2A|nr:hypothetical protein [Leptospira interrogans]MCL8310115.1 hypothetical protein [Leptospira interrogans]UNE66903.1 hypothetical protein FH588_20740 [Leptospira interrogans]
MKNNISEEFRNTLQDCKFAHLGLKFVVEGLEIKEKSVGFSLKKQIQIDPTEVQCLADILGTLESRIQKLEKAEELILNNAEVVS